MIRLLDSYVMALTGNLDADTERQVVKVVEATFGRGSYGKEALPKVVNLPDDMDQRILSLWKAQPAGTDPRVFTLAVSDGTFVSLIDPRVIGESVGAQRRPPRDGLPAAGPPA